MLYWGGCGNVRKLSKTGPLKRLQKLSQNLLHITAERIVAGTDEVAHGLNYWADVRYIWYFISTGFSNNQHLGYDAGCYTISFNILAIKTSDTSTSSKNPERCQDLLCPIVCTDIFIERHRDLELQAMTWNNYKNKTKYNFPLPSSQMEPLIGRPAHSIPLIEILSENQAFYIWG